MPLRLRILVKTNYNPQVLIGKASLQTRYISLRQNLYQVWTNLVLNTLNLQVFLKNKPVVIYTSLRHLCYMCRDTVQLDH